MPLPLLPPVSQVDYILVTPQSPQSSEVGRLWKVFIFKPTIIFLLLFIYLFGCICAQAFTDGRWQKEASASVTGTFTISLYRICSKVHLTSKGRFSKLLPALIIRHFDFFHYLLLLLILIKMDSYQTLKGNHILNKKQETKVNPFIVAGILAFWISCRLFWFDGNLFQQLIFKHIWNILHSLYNGRFTSDMFLFDKKLADKKADYFCALHILPPLCTSVPGIFLFNEFYLSAILQTCRLIVYEGPYFKPLVSHSASLSSLTHAVWII